MNICNFLLIEFCGFYTELERSFYGVLSNEIMIASEGSDDRQRPEGWPCNCFCIESTIQFYVALLCRQSWRDCPNHG